MFSSAIFLRRAAARIGAALILAACGGKGDGSVVEPPPPSLVPTTLTAAPTEAQTVALGTVVDEIATVTLKDQNGAGMANVWIKWTPSSGTVVSDSSQTDGNGIAKSSIWTLGTVSGVQTITARTGALSVVALSANVTPGPMVGLVTASTNVSGVVGSTLSTPASVKAVDKYGNGVPGVFVQFAMWAGNGSITGNRQATNENGIATVGSWKLGPLSGQQTIRADDHMTGATTMVHAAAIPAAASQFVIVDGNSQTGQAGKRLCTSPVIAVRDEYGNGVAQIPVVFTPGAGSGIVTDASVVTAANGTAALGTWTLSGVDTQTLVVTSPAIPGVSLTLTATVVPAAAYSVCTRYLGSSGTPRQRQAVATAIERWQRVIAGHAGTTPLTENANRCFSGQPAINEVVEDLLLYVQIVPMDGPGTRVAEAGPCAVHLALGLTQMGVLRLDSADLDLLLGQGTLDPLVTHELGHVLGFGTYLWYTRNLLTGAGTDDPFFIGQSARAQFALLPNNYAGTPVPVENTGGFGTRDAHWRRTIFNNELMQGFTAPNMPMSRVTVGSLADLGYTVDLTKADAFSFTSAARLSTGSASEIVNDVFETDIWGSAKDGRRVLVRSAHKPVRRR
ncbi:MAG: hypothetical protein H7Z40_05335 [Phycisphaerae bacterium]|nr:hypothetical protein [Gemmatimonadaceae bacterium]